MDMQEAVAVYLTQLAADGRSPHTIGQARRHLALLARFVGERDVEAITHPEIARFLVSAMATKTADGRLKKAGSINTLRSSVRSFLAFAHAAGLVQQNAARLVRRARTGLPMPRGLTAAERDQLVVVLRARRGEAALRDRVFFGLLLGTGIRLGSALALDVGDVDLAEGSLLLRSVKNGGTQRVYMPDAMATELHNYIGPRTGGPLFQGAGGARLGSRQAHRRLALAAAAARITRPISAHALRHSFALGLYERTQDLGLVQAALGHRSITSTVVYARVSQERVRAAVRAQ